MDVVCVGAGSIDLVYALPAAPVPDSPASKLRIASHTVSPGGQAATVACTCASLGASAQYVGTVGNDSHAAALIAALEARRVDTRGVIRREAPSPYAVILIDTSTGERMVLWDRHPAARLRAADVDRLELTSVRTLFVDDVDEEAALRAAERGRAAGVRRVSDIERVSPLTPRLIDAVDVNVFAEHVPQALVEAPTPEAALPRLTRRPDQWSVVTLGARGAALLAGGEMYRVQGHRIDALDTTGAGDVFRGGLISALLRGDSPGDALAWANAAAAVSCTRMGAIAGVPTEAEIRALLDASP